MTLNITNFVTNGKHVCDFLCVHNLSCSFPRCDVVNYWSNFHCLKMVLLFNATVLGEAWINYCKIWSSETRNSLLSYGAKHISISWTVKAWLTRLTDGQTDRQTHFATLRGKNVDRIRGTRSGRTGGYAQTERAAILVEIGRYYTVKNENMLLWYTSYVPTRLSGSKQ